MRKKNEPDPSARPLPRMFVGDTDAVAPLRDLSGEPSPGVPDVPRPGTKDVEPPHPAGAEEGEPDTGSMLYVVGALGIVGLARAAGVPAPLTSLLLIVVPLATFVLYLWNTTRDADVAEADRAELHPMADLRNWLRRVLGIQVR